MEGAMKEREGGMSVGEYDMLGWDDDEGRRGKN